MKLYSIKPRLTGVVCCLSVIVDNMFDIRLRHRIGYGHRLHSLLGENFRLRGERGGREKSSARCFVERMTHPPAMHELAGNQSASLMYSVCYC